MSEYGPFASVVGVACGLVATFSLLLLKMLGSIKRWAWLASDSPPFLVTAGARVLAVALMAVIYVSVNESNYRWFAAASVVFGLSGFMSVARFDRLRRTHVVRIPQVGPGGEQLVDKRNDPIYQNVVIGGEDQLLPEAAKALKGARKRHGGISLPKFMSGYGSPVNDPEALWPRILLAKIGSRLTMSLMGIILFAVMAVFCLVINGDAWHLPSRPVGPADRRRPQNGSSHFESTASTAPAE